MTSEKQIEANRINALNSTGPQTTEGKARSCRNAFKHGLSSKHFVIDGEDYLYIDQTLDDLIEHTNRKARTNTCSSNASSTA